LEEELVNDSPEARFASQRERGAWNRATMFHTRVVETIERVLGERFGLSLSEYMALDSLAEAAGEAGLRMQALADAIGLNQSSVSRLVARLEREDLVERTMHIRDRRGVHARITDKGRAVRDAAVPVYLQTLAAEFDRAAADPELRDYVLSIAQQPGSQQLPERSERRTRST
jgi:DNA-binding MarR family transcriptional regulator